MSTTRELQERFDKALDWGRAALAGTSSNLGVIPA